LKLSDLGSELREALAAARFQVVLCSTRAAQSKWVNEEILAFKRTHGEYRTLAVIIDGEPYAGGAEECFPPALRYRLSDDGTLSDKPAEPIAADIRKGKDGRRLARLKLLAGISGVRLDQLVRREAARRQRWLVAVAAGSSLVALITMGLAIYAEGQRRVAVEQRAMAQSSLNFLIGTFEIANPAKENPRSITALTILDRASTRAQREFAGRPQIAASLLRATGGIYYNLGLTAESQRDLTNALALETSPTGRARTLLQLSMLAQRGQKLAAMKAFTARAASSYDESASDALELDALVAEQRAFIAYATADYPEAARRFAVAEKMFRRLDGDFRAKTLDMMNNEGRSLVQAKRPSLADSVYVRAIALAMRTYGIDDLRTARALNNRALALLAGGNAAAARTQMERALAILTRVLDRNHPNLAAAQLVMGRILVAEGKPGDAVEAFDRARTAYIQLYGPTNEAVGDVDFYTAEALSAAGQTTKALALADNVKLVYDKAYGPNDPDQAELLLLRSRILAHSGQFLAATSACRLALTLQQKLRVETGTIEATRKACGDLSAR